MPDPAPTGYLSAEQLRAALAEAGVPVAAAATPDAGAAKLREYWVHGPGAAKIRWGSAGDFDRCVMHLGKYVTDPKGLCNTYHQEALGAPPGKGHAAAAPAAPVESLRGVELARPGTFQLSSGKTTFTEAMLSDAADFYAATGRGAIPVGLGHMDQRFDGDPAFGWVENIRYHTDARGPVLLGDLVDMPGWLAAEAPKRWRNRSIEAFSNVEFGGRTYAMALTRLALLGATPPGIPSITSLSDLQTALAASTRLVASIADPEPPEPPPAAPPPEPPTQEGAGMDPAKLREALGLNPDASDQDVTAAIAAAGLAAPPPPPAPPPGLTPQFVAPAPPQPVQDVPQAQPVPVAASSGLRQLPPGTVVIDATQLAEFQAGMAQSQRIAATIAKRDRDDTIAAAVAKGKFPPARRQHWEQLWDADPDGTREVLDRLEAGLVPVQASGYPGGPVDGDDLQYAQFAHLFPPDPQQQGGGRRG